MALEPPETATLPFAKLVKLSSSRVAAASIVKHRGTGIVAEQPERGKRGEGSGSCKRVERSETRERRDSRR